MKSLWLETLPNEILLKIINKLDKNEGFKIFRLSKSLSKKANIGYYVRNFIPSMKLEAPTPSEQFNQDVEKLKKKRESDEEKFKDFTFDNMPFSLDGSHLVQPY